MNIIESFTAHLFHLHSIYQQLLGLTDKEELLTYQLNWALYKLTCKSPWFCNWQGPLAALIMDSVRVCVYQPSPFSTYLATTPQTSCRKAECSRTKRITFLCCLTSMIGFLLVIWLHTLPIPVSDLTVVLYFSITTHSGTVQCVVCCCN